jgi:hypothetical protein
MDGTRNRSTVQIAFQIRPGSEEINCCSANAPRGLGMISDWALMTDGQGLIVNWYGPSTLSAKLKGTAVRITQRTGYPREGRIALVVAPDKAASFPLRLRIPHWSAKSVVKVNDQTISNVKPGSYLVLERKWNPGDTVQLDLDMSLHYWVGERECAGTASLYHGPLLLVQEVDRRNEAVQFSPEWKRREDMAAITKDIGATVEAVFEGASVVWNGWFFDDAGQAQVTIDGREVAVVDQYGPVREVPFQWEYRDLPPGKHTIKITLLSKKNEKSKGHWINVGSIVPPMPGAPVFDMASLEERPVPAAGPMAPVLAMDIISAEGKPVRLRDYATAGEGGVSYVSWMKMKNAVPTAFSESNPWRSGRAVK